VSTFWGTDQAFRCFLAMTAEAVLWQKGELTMSEKNMLGGSGLAEVAGPLKDFAEKLGGEEGKEWLAAFKRFLRTEEPWPKVPEFPIWKTIKLGTGLKVAEDFRHALSDGGFRLSDWANGILGKPAFTAAAEETEVDLIKVTVAELGFKKGARRDQIYERAKELGLELCSPEVGPQLRLQYHDQPNGEWILVAMEPIIGSDGGPDVFYVERLDSGLWLDSNWSNPDDFWNADNQWVFCLPCK